MNAREVGSYIRDQRLKAKLSLHGVSNLAGVSIPYLSQIERGLRKPSADILYAISKALRISAGSLYVRAGILEDSPVPDVASAILGDSAITERQKQALVQIYEAFREEAGRDAATLARDAGANGPPTTREKQPHRPTRPSRSPGTAPQATPSSRSPAATRPPPRALAAGEAGGGAKPRAGNSPHPAPIRSSTPNRRKEV
jgi:transcriptional regulator with XRE-family HTH domain